MTHLSRLFAYCGLLAILCSTAFPPAVNAQTIQPYQIRRVVSYDTPCRLGEVGAAQQQADGSLAFLVDCENDETYPDGLLILCKDPRNERSCKPLTEPRVFKNLELMRPSKP